jgi:hypothetical protein
MIRRSTFTGLASAMLAVATAAAPALRAQDVTPAGSATDARVGLHAGRYDAGQAAWNLKLLSATPSPDKFENGINSDLAFFDHYAIQGNFNGYQIWDISNPAHPVLRVGYFCPASQSDVSVYKNLLITSSESNSGRLDCGAEGVKDTVSAERIRGIRIFDISDLDHPRYVANVQTCRGSHTHSLLVDPNDKANVYVYISGSAGLRSPSELPGCLSDSPSTDPNSALMRIEVIRIPLAHPEQAAIVSSPRIFQDLKAPATHGQTAADSAASAAAIAKARANGGFVVNLMGSETVLPPQFVKPQLDSIVKARGGSGAPTGADSAALRAGAPGNIDRKIGPPPPPKLK